MNLPGVIIKVKFTSGFKDGNVSPQTFKANQIVELTAEQAQLARASGARFDVLETKLPPSSPAAAEKPRGKKAGKDAA
jgi:hypothetical protein